MKEIFIRFLAPVIPQTISPLFQMFDGALQNKIERLHLMLSSPGGSVFHGISVYNFLRGMPFETYTYNFGSVDSIGVIMFCAGKKRFSVPHARFLIHGVQFNMQGNVAFDEKQMEEHLKSIQIDQENISRIISDTTGKPLHQLKDDMHNRTTLNPQQAKDYGLVHEIQSSLLPIDAQLLVIGEPVQQNIPFAIRATNPLINAYTETPKINT